MLQGEEGQRGPPGAPGNVSPISAVSVLHVNLLYSHSQAICDAVILFDSEFSADVANYYFLSVSSQVANVIPEPGEPVSRLLSLNTRIEILFFFSLKLLIALLSSWL